MELIAALVFMVYGAGLYKAVTGPSAKMATSVSALSASVPMRDELLGPKPQVPSSERMGQMFSETLGDE